MDIKNLFRKKRVEPRVLIESNSPNCNIQAIVEEDDRCVYFYLFGEPNFKDRFVNSCWVRNYGKAPKETDVQTMREGSAPMLISAYCAHPNGAEKLDSSKLEIVWFEEGDGAALLYNDEIISVIPGWADEKCPGYSRDCIKESQFAWPLGNPSENVLHARVRKSKAFCDNWNSKSFGEIQKAYLTSIEKSIGKYNKYYAIDGEHWPPKAMVTIEKDDLTYLITIGVSIIPQPKVEMYFENPKDYRRFELGFVIETELLNRNRNGILSYISGQTSLPWSCLTWLGHGHTIPCDRIWPDASEFPYVLLVSNNSFDMVPDIKLPSYKEDKVNILWMVPITAEEKIYAEVNCSQSLIEEHLKDNEKLCIFRGNSKFDI